MHRLVVLFALASPGLCAQAVPEAASAPPRTSISASASLFFLLAGGEAVVERRVGRRLAGRASVGVWTYIGGGDRLRPSAAASVVGLTGGRRVQGEASAGVTVMDFGEIRLVPTLGTAVRFYLPTPNGRTTSEVMVRVGARAMYGPVWDGDGWLPVPTVSVGGAF